MVVALPPLLSLSLALTSAPHAGCLLALRGGANEVKIVEPAIRHWRGGPYVSSVKSPRDAYIGMSSKGRDNAKLSVPKILHQSVMGGCYVGFAGLLSLAISSSMPGLTAANPGLQKLIFAALFPVNLLLILMSGGQLFTGNTAAVAAALFEGEVGWADLAKSWGVSYAGAPACGQRRPPGVAAPPRGAPAAPKPRAPQRGRLAGRGAPVSRTSRRSSPFRISPPLRVGRQRPRLRCDRAARRLLRDALGEHGRAGGGDRAQKVRRALRPDPRQGHPVQLARLHRRR